MRTRGNTLVATMVTLVIIAVLGVAMMFGSNMFRAGGPQSPRKDGKGVTVPGLVKAQAEDTVCRSNLSQVKQAIMVWESSNPDGGHPSSIDELHLPPEFSKCPMGHEPYSYDPATGEVHCPHPGHEKY